MDAEKNEGANSTRTLSRRNRYTAVLTALAFKEPDKTPKLDYSPKGQYYHGKQCLFIGKSRERRFAARVGAETTLMCNLPSVFAPFSPDNPLW